MDHWNICRTRDPKLWSLKVTKQVGHFWFLFPINVVVVVKHFFYIHTCKRRNIYGEDGTAARFLWS